MSRNIQVVGNKNSAPDTPKRMVLEAEGFHSISTDNPTNMTSTFLAGLSGKIHFFSHSVHLWVVESACRIVMAAKIGIRKLRLVHIIGRERVQLANLSEEQLRDIGINRATADSESRKAKFDIPRSRQIEAGLLDTGTRE